MKDTHRARIGSALAAESLLQHIQVCGVHELLWTSTVRT
jgi:hypothetical protein